MDNKQKEISSRFEEAAQLDPTTKIILEGKGLIMEYTNTEVKGLLNSTGLNILAKTPDREFISNPSNLQFLLFWALKKHQPDITEEVVDGYLTLKRHGYVVRKVQECLEVFYPEVDDLIDKKKSTTDPKVTEVSGSSTGASAGISV